MHVGSLHWPGGSRWASISYPSCSGAHRQRISQGESQHWHVLAQLTTVSKISCLFCNIGSEVSAIHVRCCTHRLTSLLANGSLHSAPNQRVPVGCSQMNNTSPFTDISFFFLASTNLITLSFLQFLYNSKFTSRYDRIAHRLPANGYLNEDVFYSFVLTAYH